MLTTLPDSSGTETLVAFDDQGTSLSPVIPDLGLPATPTITTNGITHDTLGNFVIAAAETSLLDGAPGYVTITPGLSQFSASMSTPTSQNGPTPEPRGIVQYPDQSGFVIATVPSQGEAIADYYQDPLINVLNDAPLYTPAQIRHAYGVDQITFTGPGGQTI